MYSSDEFYQDSTWTYSWHTDITKTGSYDFVMDNYFGYQGPDGSYSEYYSDYFNLDGYDWYDNLEIGDTYSYGTDFVVDRTVMGDFAQYSYNYMSYGPDYDFTYSDSELVPVNSWEDASNYENYSYINYYADYSDYYSDDVYDDYNVSAYNYDPSFSAEIFGENTYNLLYVNDDSLSLSLQDLNVVSSDGVILSHIEAIAFDSFDGNSTNLSLTDSVVENLSSLHYGDLGLLDFDLADGISQLTSQYGSASDLNPNDSVLFVGSFTDTSVNFTDNNWHLLGSVDLVETDCYDNCVTSYNAYIHDSAANTHSVVLMGSEISQIAGVA